MPSITPLEQKGGVEGRQMTDVIRNLDLTRMLLLQATVKRFQFDLYVNLEGQQMLISSWGQKEVS